MGSLLLDDRLRGDRVDDRVAGAGLRLYGVCLGFVCQQPVDDDSFLRDRAEEVPDSIRYKISRYLRHISGFILCSWDVAPDRFGNPSLGLSHGSTPDFLAIIIRRDLPLSELPYIGKRFASKKN